MKMRSKVQGEQGGSELTSRSNELTCIICASALHTGACPSIRGPWKGVRAGGRLKSQGSPRREDAGPVSPRPPGLPSRLPSRSRALGPAGSPSSGQAGPSMGPALPSCSSKGPGLRWGRRRQRSRWGGVYCGQAQVLHCGRDLWSGAGTGPASRGLALMAMTPDGP